MNAFQMPASKVAITLIVPKEQYTRVSGLQSLSESIISIITPIAATFIMSLFGIQIIFILDLVTFILAFISLLLFVRIPFNRAKEKVLAKNNFVTESLEGFIYLKNNKQFLSLMLFMAAINFIAAMAFFSVMPPMILARTSNNMHILGMVSGAFGIGGIVGGLVVTIIKPPKSKVKAIFISAALSFLLCNVLLGIGKNPFVWVFAAFLGNLPIPFLMASENAILHSKIPTEMQGRIFSIRGSVQFFTMPIGYLVGGFLADYVFVPLVINLAKTQSLLETLVGSGEGGGMALMFVFTGISGFILSIIGYSNKTIRELDQ